MMGVTVDFDDNDAKVIAFLVDHFDGNGRHVDVKDIVASTKIGYEEIVRILERFSNYELVERLTHGGSLWAVEPGLLSVAVQLRTKPERDYPKDFEKWFRGKWWSVPVQIIFVGLPAFVGYIAMLRAILAWFGIGI